MITPIRRKLRIAQVAPLWTSVPPEKYGGAELMVSWLTEELVKRGHEVTLFASADSRTAAKLRLMCERNIIQAMAHGEAYQYESYAVSAFVESLKDASSFDIIHSHIGCAFIPIAELSKAPVLHTVHAALDLVDELLILKRYPNAPIAAISRSQVALALQQGRENIRVIYHGCDFDRFEPSFAPGEYLAFLSRMGSHKNPLAAIQIAAKVGLPIVLGVSRKPSPRKPISTSRSKPPFDGRNVIYRGEVSQAEKVRLSAQRQRTAFPH